MKGAPVFRKKTPDLGAIDWRADRDVVRLTGRVRDLEIAEAEARQRFEAADAVSTSAAEVLDLEILVDAGREDASRLETARAARARAVVARDDHRKAQTTLDQAGVELASATMAARQRALDAIRTAGLAGLDELAERLTVAAEANAYLRTIANAAEAAFSYDELRNVFGNHEGLAALTTPFPEIQLGSADRVNPSGLQVWLDRRPRTLTPAP